jgi:wyosine [tRNA(Phe)-imidazoG37] synthetase (radical SAM superfamily)
MMDDGSDTLMTDNDGISRRHLRLIERDVDRGPPLVYGPVQSLRFGRSLGINLLPDGLRLCNFDCLYCQCGGERRDRRERDDPPFPSLEVLERQLSRVLAEDPWIDDVCFAGAGEPTMHPQFREAVLVARALRSELAPRATLTVLSNGTTAGKPEVRAALALVDRAVLKLDAVGDDLLRRLDRSPSGLSARRLVRSFGEMIGVETQTMLVRGAVDNATPEALDALGEALRYIFPRRAHIGTITRRPAVDAADQRLTALEPAELEAAAARVRRRAPGVDVRVY